MDLFTPNQRLPTEAPAPPPHWPYAGVTPTWYAALDDDGVLQLARPTTAAAVVLQGAEMGRAAHELDRAEATAALAALPWE